MTLSPGARVGPYEITGILGAGGMGEVYRARDSQLRRDVAIKMLPRDWAYDANRLARFEREARILASLNHPNIATVYGIEQSGSATALVMELVEGATLADRIGSGLKAQGSGLPLEEVLSIARQIADALDAAHERGIIHRDLKPANIKITPDGVVKVLDFGLAKSVAGTDEVIETNHATLTIPGTREGSVVGTPAYMSPEQSRGQAVDRRTDIWAFGCVLYEMLSGRSPYAGPTTSDTIVKILQNEPDWSLLPPNVPIAIRRLVQRCLEKDVKRRQRDVGDARRVLDDGVAEEAPRATTPRRARWSVAAGAGVVAAAVLIGGWWLAADLRPTAGTKGPTLTRVTFDGDFAVEPTISADGSLIVYASDAAGQGNLDLWAQRGSAAPVRLTQNDADDHQPDFSPDGNTIAFRSERDGGGVYVMPALGGDARLIGAGGRQPKFSPDSTQIAYWTGSPLGSSRAPGASVFVVSANGGTARRLAAGFSHASNPIWSPDGRAIVFFGQRTNASPEQRAGLVADADVDWWWLPLVGGEPVATGVYPALVSLGASFLAANASDSFPESWGPGGIVFSATTGQAMNLWLVSISPTRGKIVGSPVRLTTGTGSDGSPSVDRSGRIVFQTSKANEAVFGLPLDPNRGTVSGNIERFVTGWEFGVHRGSVSRDGRTLAFPRQRPENTELWVKNLETGAARHLMTTRRTELNPTISPDGSQISYMALDNADQGAGSASPAAATGGYVIAAAGGTPIKLCDDCTIHAWLSDNRRVVVDFRNQHPRIRIVNVVTRQEAPIFDNDVGVQRAFTTADDRWIAFSGNNAVAWIVPLQPGHVATPQTAQVIQLPNSPVVPSRICGWSRDGRLLYELLGTDGFRCLYAQRMDPARGTVDGDPFVVQHFHDPQRVWGSTPLGNAISDRGFVFDQVETSSSIWLLAPER